MRLSQFEDDDPNLPMARGSVDLDQLPQMNE